MKSSTDWPTLKTVLLAVATLALLSKTFSNSFLIYGTQFGLQAAKTQLNKRMSFARI